MYKKESLCHYNTIKYGKNIDNCNESINNHKCKVLNLSRTKSKYIFILAQKDKLVASNKNL